MDTVNQNTGMRDVWCWALSWYRKPPSSADKRARQARVIAAVLAECRTATTPGDLTARYLDAKTAHRCVAIAAGVEPATWPTLGVHACTAAAFGIRYVELATGATIDPAALPHWLGEWAIW